MQCFTWLLLLACAVVVMATIVRWFEQVTEAVDRREWKKVMVLVVVPPAVWMYRSQVSAGRPSAVPHHEPVRGFGTAPLTPRSTQPSTEAPPSGTPKEFLEMPMVPPAKKPSRAAVDAEKVAKLRQKMREQGMLGQDD